MNTIEKTPKASSKRNRPLTATIEGKLAERVRKHCRALGFKPATTIKQCLDFGLLMVETSPEAIEFQNYQRPPGSPHKVTPIAETFPGVNLEPFIVPNEWVRVTTTMEREDLEFLEGFELAFQQKLGTEAWYGITCGDKVTPELCSGHAEVSDPVEVTLAMEHYYLDSIIAACETAKVDMASAIRLALFTRCMKIRRNLKRKNRKQGKAA